eukprot:CAMPEP_0119550752 /NCGR_PEP_ID=MMETSP1352-20130426/4209_1 /TAXON_ID=265584 /ORGANISM="Stauroneis constricta, Strain CCMP1120" /LENGTH=1028 /DNA_ID=CAMNT_0007596701 /DNA_START=754 /DNA_END=3840 /DNA_ORIENTATION=+
MKFGTAAFSLLVFNAMFLPRAMAMMANPEPFELTQPDGSTIHCRLIGDEDFHDMVDMHDYTVVKNSADEYVYAHLASDGEIAPTKYVVGKSNPKAMHIPKHVAAKHHAATGYRKLTKDAVGDDDAAALVANVDQNHRRAARSQGKVKNIVLLIRFSDHVNRALPTAAEISELMNADKGQFSDIIPTGSVKHHFLEYSYDKLEIESTVLDWVTVSQTELFVTNGSSGINTRLHDVIKEALADVQRRNEIDFSNFDDDNDGFVDGFTVFHSSYAAESGGVDPRGLEFADRVWSHRWNLSGRWESNDGVKFSPYNVNPALWLNSGSEIGRVGVVTHELGHFFGLPDLYDPEPASATAIERGSGIGSYGLMSNAWGFDGSQRFPPHPSPWSRLRLGWAETVTPQAGVNSIVASELKSNQPQFFKIGDGTGGFLIGEYLLIENRQPIGADQKLPQGGLIIWHIDEKANDRVQGWPGQEGWPSNGKHYRVAVLPADGNYDLERGRNGGDVGDVFHANGVDRLGPSTGNPNTGPFPNTDTYQFGIVQTTGNTISDISVSGNTMTFRCTGPGCESNGPQPTDAPTKAPTTASPTKSPTKAPTTNAPTKSPTKAPTTDSPTKAPTTNSPTMSPTKAPTTMSPTAGGGGGDNQCSSNESLFELRLVTDNFGDETSWNINNGSGSIRQGSGYENNKVYLIKECIPKNDCYTFVIDDTFGDGICCNEGIGSYTISLDGAFVAVGGEFTFSDSSGQFGAQCGVDPPPVPVTTNAPTKAPTTMAPTKSPTKAPTTDSDQTECNSSQQKIRIELNTDNFGEETNWKILDSSNGAVLHQSTAAYPNAQSGIVEERCIPKDGCFTFEINDTFGDGMCCNEGDGSYRALADGQVIAAGGNFGAQDTTEFGNQCGGNPAACGPGQTEFRLLLQTDNFGDETSWTVKTAAGNGNTVLSGSAYPNNESVNEKHCISNSECYEFMIVDSFGDGMCCNEGDGSYNVDWNGNTLRTGGNFGSEESFLFGACPARRRRGRRLGRNNNNADAEQ